ncbi:hypothetical protein BpHYR1_046450 [Brachionus plicatilis]|uniref:Uncharacterized protein n=1 Tax=Brachionus plicatilis TaxID=10195 RepID=A0A3M7RHJ1_BRAPC|nr:hypothetical protein BpHYR1_046450 [Brachionus plicatilis]
MTNLDTKYGLKWKLMAFDKNEPNLPTTLSSIHSRTLGPNLHHQSVDFGPNFQSQRKDYMVKAISEKYPTKFVIFYSIVTILIGIAEIALQIVNIVNNGALNFIGSGIWGECYCILLGILALSLLKCKNYSLIYFSILANATVCLVIKTLIIINGLGISFNFRKTFNSPNKEMLPNTISMLILGLFATIMSILYLVMICKIGKNQQLAIYPQAGYSDINPQELNYFKFKNNYNNSEKIISGFFV